MLEQMMGEGKRRIKHTGATFNPSTSGPNTVLTSGNIVAKCASDGSNYGNTGSHAYGTIGRSTGRWYFEMMPTVFENNIDMLIGVAIAGVNTGLRNTTSALVYQVIQNYSPASNRLVNGNSISINYGSGYTTNDYVGVGIDFEAGTIFWSTNGVSQGTINLNTYLTGRPLFPVTGNINASSSSYTITNYIQTPKYLPANYDAW